jgi:MFS transporter, DHA2 family, multidrug resistance protein
VAVSVWITSYSAGAAIGPPLGGVLLEYFWWGSVFLLAVPVMVLLLAVGPKLLPEFRDPDAGKPDLPSAGLSLAAVLTIIYGLKQIAEHGLEWLPALMILAGVALGVAFVRRQQTLADPLIDLRLLRVPAFSASLATYMMGGIVMFGSFVFVAQYLQLVLDLSPLEAGLWTMPLAGSFVVGSMLTPLIARQGRPAVVIASGLVVAAGGFALLSQVGASGGLAMLMPALIIFSLGLAPVFTLTTDMMIGTAPPERAGAAAAISETGAEFGGALGIAVLGSVGAAIYRGQVDDAIPPDMSPEAAESARSTLGEAIAVAESLPGPLGVELVTAARDAFTQSLELTAILSAVLATFTAVLVAVVLRNVDGGHADEAPQEQAPPQPEVFAPVGVAVEAE